jgi:hypothetical protein
MPSNTARSILVALAFAATAVLADNRPYETFFQITVESDHLVALHQHDWSYRTWDARQRVSKPGGDIFSGANDFSWLEVTEKPGGRRLFRTPVPALSVLWISPDSRYIVGISRIKLHNPVQLVVFGRDGKLRFRQHVGWKTFPGVTESDTNFVYWYDEPEWDEAWRSPAISMRRSGDDVTITIAGNEGAAAREITFRDP